MSRLGGEVGSSLSGVLCGRRHPTSESRFLIFAALLALASCTPAEEPPGSGASLPVVKTDGGVEMVRIPEGDFEMGSARGRDVEQPVHKVHLDEFLMDRTEVTQEQYEKFKLPNPSRFKGPSLPVEMIPLTVRVLQNTHLEQRICVVCEDSSAGTLIVLLTSEGIAFAR